MRVLHADATDADAALAMVMFCRSVAEQIAAMMASFGGMDMIVFTGSIGEHDAIVRDTICTDLAWAGVPAGRSQRTCGAGAAGRRRSPA
ncbi:hypothetical protein [Sphingomonas solaris]|nr:hypothetical protein [Sphingomonas solaris]